MDNFEPLTDEELWELRCLTPPAYNDSLSKKERKAWMDKWYGMREEEQNKHIGRWMDLDKKRQREYEIIQGPNPIMRNLFGRYLWKTYGNSEYFNVVDQWEKDWDLLDKKEQKRRVNRFLRLRPERLRIRNMFPFCNSFWTRLKYLFFPKSVQFL